ncbi:MAG: alpha/beta hydrolase [Sinobacteraceae bacterium]|nr:alpha/beta hydrolase [Nevskiaceae bacterium]
MGVRFYLHFIATGCTTLALIMASALAIAAPGTAPEGARPGTLQSLMVAGSRDVAPRQVKVWLPPGFDRSKRYAVLYLHDGQMLFGNEQTWNSKSWDIDRTLAALLEKEVIRDVIVVAIDNDPNRRHAEFFPDRALEFLHPPALRDAFVSQALGQRPAAKAYLDFIVNIVKPEVDTRYPTDPSRDATFIMGSSMGGLISLYALCEYPQIFGAAASLSTHWIGSFERNGEIPRSLRDYLDRHLPPANAVRIYMDRGTKDLDALYEDAQREVDSLMQRKGFTAPGFQSRIYPGAGHDEQAWRDRSAEPLRFLLAR